MRIDISSATHLSDASFSSATLGAAATAAMSWGSSAAPRLDRALNEHDHDRNSRADGRPQLDSHRVLRISEAVPSLG